MTTDKHNKRPNVPPLRFPEFTEPWETAKLGAIAEFSKGTGISKEQRSETGLPCILYGELYTTYTNEVIEDVVSKTDLDPTDLVKSQKNDVIIPSSGETAEDIATARCVTSDNVLLGGDLNIIRLVEPNDGRFMSYQLNGIRKYDIAKIAQGVSVVHLYGGDLKMLSVTFPQSPEQKKIADCISLLDRRISVQIGLIEDLQKLKAALCNTIFSTMKTKIVKVGELAEVYQPRTISQRELMENARYLVYGANGIIGKYHNYNHEESQVCITCRGNTCGAVCFTQPQSWITGNAMVINVDKVQDKLSKKFLYYYLCGYNFTPIISGSGQPQIVRKPIEDIWLPLPTLKEQIFIVKKIDAIENKLQIENKLVDLFSKQKQYLLQQMFI